MTPIRLNQSWKQLVLTMLLLTLGATLVFAQRATPVYEKTASSLSPNVPNTCVTTVTISDWAFRRGFSSIDPGSFEMFKVNHSGRNPALGWLSLGPAVQFNCVQRFTIVDDATGAALMFDSAGDYSFAFCPKSTTPLINGVGGETATSCKTMLVDGVGKNAGHAVSALVNTCTNVASATLSFGGTTYKLNEANINNPMHPNCLNK